MSDEIKKASENAILLFFARMSQVILVPLISAMLFWGLHTINQLQIEMVRVQSDIGKAITTSEANNRLLVEIVGDIKQRVIRLEEKKL